MNIDDVGSKLGTLDFEGSSLDLSAILTRSYDDIGLASVELPAVIEWVNIQLQDAIVRRIKRKHRVAEVEAEVYFELVRSDFAAVYACKPTAAAVNSAVSIDDRVKTAYSKYAEAEAWVSRLRSLQDSLTAKLDLVRSTESTRRRVADFETQ